MRILTDFDGVLTAQDAEAAAVNDRLVERIAEALRGDQMRANAVVSGFRAEVRANPAVHGWFTGDKIGCYADEDPYVFNNAVCRAIFEGSREVAEKVRAIGLDSADALAMACFEEGTRRFREGNKPHVLDEALGAIQTFFAAGAEVVIVSNSSTERVQAILGPTAILRWGTGKIRLRGGARKFDVTGDRPKEVPEAEDFGGRQIQLRRGSYADILIEEQPDAIIGDVLSLDVALPAALRAHDPRFEEMQVFLKRHPHTPKWALDGCAAKGVTVVDSIAKLPEMLAM